MKRVSREELPKTSHGRRTERPSVGSTGKRSVHVLSKRFKNRNDFVVEEGVVS